LAWVDYMPERLKQYTRECGHLSQY